MYYFYDFFVARRFECIFGICFRFPFFWSSMLDIQLSCTSSTYSFSIKTNFPVTMIKIKWMCVCVCVQYAQMSSWNSIDYDDAYNEVIERFQQSLQFYSFLYYRSNRSVFVRLKFRMVYNIKSATKISDSFKSYWNSAFHCSFGKIPWTKIKIALIWSNALNLSLYARDQAVIYWLCLVCFECNQSYRNISKNSLLLQSEIDWKLVSTSYTDHCLATNLCNTQALQLKNEWIPVLLACWYSIF